jgi:parallel beta-helix repeat protein
MNKRCGVLWPVVVPMALVAGQFVSSLDAAKKQAAPAPTVPSRAPGLTEYYVDPDFAGSLRNGSAANPWTHLGSSPGESRWTAINSALATNDVIIYFSARSAARDTNQISTFGVSLARTDKSNHRLTLDGMSEYNADDIKPSWSRYDGPSRLEIQSGYPISAYLPGTNQDHVTIRGFKAIGGFGGRGGQALVYWGGSHVLIENCEFLHDPAAKHGACVQFNYAWSERGERRNGGCTDLTIRNNVIHDTFGEGIYIGGSGNTLDPSTGKVRPAHSQIVIEGNHIYNTGLRGGEGDCIDLKDGLSDVTLRNNVCHHTRGGNATGISSHSPFTAEDNVVYSVDGHGISFGTYWGSGFQGVVIRHNLVFNNGKCGIYMSSDAGKPVTLTLIEDNTVYGNHGAGLSVGVNPDGSITGLQVRNNIFSRNAPGIGGYGRASYVITGNDFHANQPDYRWPFRAADDPALAGQNLALDPLFANPDDPAGPDGKFFTADDGLAHNADFRSRRSSQ